jgi:tetratricopeptide (TPR) repeat protein
LRLSDAWWPWTPCPRAFACAIAWLAIWAALLGTAHVSRADSSSDEQRSSADKERAAELYRVGSKHYNLGEYERAIASFKQAYRLSAAPELLFNIAQAHRLKGKAGCSEALRFYKTYLRLTPKGPHRGKVEAAMVDMERCVQRQRDRRVRPGAAWPATRPTTGARDSARKPSRVLPLALGSVGLALVAGAAAALIWTRSEHNRLVDRGCAPYCDAEKVDTLRSAQTTGYVLLGGGAAVGTAALLSWLLSRRAEKPASVRSGRHSLWLSPTIGGASAGLCF